MLRVFLVAILLAGCSKPVDPYMLKYSQDEADKAMAKMVFCAHAVKAIPVELPDAAKDALYWDCLIQNNATI